MQDLGKAVGEVAQVVAVLVSQSMHLVYFEALTAKKVGSESLGEKKKKEER